MGRIFLDHINGVKLFSCASCDTNLTNKSELISTRFTGATGKCSTQTLWMRTLLVWFQWNTAMDKSPTDSVIRSTKLSMSRSIRVRFNKFTLFWIEATIGGAPSKWKTMLTRLRIFFYVSSEFRPCVAVQTCGQSDIYAYPRPCYVDWSPYGPRCYVQKLQNKTGLDVRVRHRGHTKVSH